MTTRSSFLAISATTGRAASGSEVPDKSVREPLGVRRLERSPVLLARGVAKRFERYEEIRSKRRFRCLATAGAVAIMRTARYTERWWART